MRYFPFFSGNFTKKKREIARFLKCNNYCSSVRTNLLQKPVVLPLTGLLNLSLPQRLPQDLLQKLLILPLTAFDTCLQRIAGLHQ